MKKLRLTFLAVVLMVATVASAQISWGVQGGLNVSNIRDIHGLEEVKFGFNIGVLTDFGFASNMSIRSGLYFTTKGANEMVDGGSGHLLLPYMQIPVHFAYKIDLRSGTRFVLHAGPYAAFGFGSNRFGNEDSQFQPFDFGVGLGAGFEFGRILTGIGWDMGLIDISHSENRNVKNRNAFLTVGYRF